MNSEKGFTLVEMLVTTAVFGVVIIGVVISYQQIVSTTMRNNRQTMAVSDVSMAALEIHKDLFMALNVVMSPGGLPFPASPNNTVEVAGGLEADGGQTVSFEWVDYVTTDWDEDGPMPQPPDEGTPHTVTYSRAGTVLTRSYDEVDWIVGRQVSYLAFTRDGTEITVEITSTVAGPPDESETLIFTFHQRQGAQ